MFTVAIPTYNGGKALIEAVQSSQNIQMSEKELEVLVVDNCSTDGSLDLLRQKCADLRCLRIVKNEENVGRVGNWNRCLELAQGEILLFLFANDLIAKENCILQAIKLFEQNRQCSLVSTPWIISNYAMSQMSSPPQFYRRTPGYGLFTSDEHIKSVAETGKLPFVPLQANFLRTKFIKEGSITFDSEFPIAGDGIFLSELAAVTGVIGFFDKPSVIWRFDAPNRSHGRIRYDEHARQNIEAFVRLNRCIREHDINYAKAFSSYQGPEYFLAALIRARSRDDFTYSQRILREWYKSIKRHEFNKAQFLALLALKLIKLPRKTKTFFTLLYERRKGGSRVAYSPS